MCQTIAENGEICSRVEKQGETRVSDYASAQCLSLPQRTPCPEKQWLGVGDFSEREAQKPLRKTIFQKFFLYIFCVATVIIAVQISNIFFKV